MPLSPDNERAWRAAICAMPAEMRQRLAPLFSESALRAARRAEITGAAIRLVAGRHGTINALAKEISRDLHRYEATAWRYDREAGEPANPRNGALFSYLRLTNGKSSSERSLRRILTPEMLARKGRGTGQPSAANLVQR